LLHSQPAVAPTEEQEVEVVEEAEARPIDGLLSQMGTLTMLYPGRG
jgi:hypothetical protein